MGMKRTMMNELRMVELCSYEDFTRSIKKYRERCEEEMMTRQVDSIRGKWNTAQAIFSTKVIEIYESRVSG